jgi:lipid II:glycine glycyltransferase (peptidoglycan interpeptide bridge formation enzyme)
LNDISDTDKVFATFFPCKQRQIRKAQKILHVEYSMSANNFYELRCKHLTAQGKKNFCSKQLVSNIINTSIQRKQGIIAKAVDDKRNIHSAIFVVWDKNCAHQIITAINPNYKDSGGSTFVVWEAIKKLSKLTKSWDFMGSMIEEVEYSNRQFGATQIPYFQIIKYIKPIKFLKFLKKQ